MLGNVGVRGHTSEPRPGPATAWLLLVVAGVWKAAGVMVASAGVMGEHWRRFPAAQVPASSHPLSSKILSEVLLSHKVPSRLVNLSLSRICGRHGVCLSHDMNIHEKTFSFLFVLL